MSTSTPARATAVLFDDNYMNFPQVPTAVATVHCPQPLTVQQLQELTCDTQQDALQFCFFDFDDTLSLSGAMQKLQRGVTPDEAMASLFGDEARQQALYAALSTLLAGERCYVLTANHHYANIATLLNMLMRRKPGHQQSQTCSHDHVANEDDVKSRVNFFAPDRTVLYTPTGTKIRIIQRIVQDRGYQLIAPA